MTLTGDRPESGHHLLVDNQYGDEQRQSPQQAVTEVLARLGVGRDATGVIIAYHHDKTGTNDGQER